MMSYSIGIHLDKALSVSCTFWQQLIQRPPYTQLVKCVLCPALFFNAIVAINVLGNRTYDSPSPTRLTGIESYPIRKMNWKPKESPLCRTWVTNTTPSHQYACYLNCNSISRKLLANNSAAFLSRDTLCLYILSSKRQDVYRSERQQI